MSLMMGTNIHINIHFYMIMYVKCRHKQKRNKRGQSATVCDDKVCGFNGADGFDIIENEAEDVQEE